MKTVHEQCDPERLLRLAEDRLPPAELTGLEQHLEWCEDCRQALDSMVGGDGCLTAARRHLRAEATEPYEPAPELGEALTFLTPSDWPDSLGRLGTYEVKGVLGYGAPVGELARIAADKQLDLLVMGTHGHRLLADLALGQTVAPLLHELAIPILVVPSAARSSSTALR